MTKHIWLNFENYAPGNYRVAVIDENNNKQGTGLFLDKHFSHYGKSVNFAGENDFKEQ